MRKKKRKEEKKKRTRINNLGISTTPGFDASGHRKLIYLRKVNYGLNIQD
jgi:hypothetical protein